MRMKEKWLPLPQLDLEGNTFMRIENYQGILEFTDKRLKLKMNGMVYQVEGENLRVWGVNKREIFLEGKLYALQIMQEQKE